MKNFKYRKLEAATAQRIMEWCEENDIEYDLFNVEDTLFDVIADFELGLTPNTWGSVISLNMLRQ